MSESPRTCLVCSLPESAPIAWKWIRQEGYQVGPFCCDDCAEIAWRWSESEQKARMIGDARAADYLIGLGAYTRSRETDHNTRYRLVWIGHTGAHDLILTEFAVPHAPA